MSTDFFKPQPRGAEIAAGIAALLSGLFALALAVWLYLRFGLPPHPERGIRFIALFTVGLGLYSLVLARRLLAAPQEQPRYLLSPFALIAMGLFLGAGALIPAILLRERLLGAVEGLILAGACVTLGIRRWHAREDDAA